MRYLKKITPKLCGCNPHEMEELARGKKKPVPVLRVYGRALEAERGATQLGPYIRFKGEFEAVNLTTGEKSRARNLILPEVGEMFVAEGLEKAKSTDENAVLQFGLDITVLEHTSSAGGWQFRWGMQALTKPAEGKDLLTEMGEKFGATPAIEKKAKSAK